MITLYHFDLPHALAQKGGWSNRETIAAFVAYARTVFQHFGAKVLETGLIALQGKGFHLMTLSEMLSPEPEPPSNVYEHQHDPGL